MKEYLLYIFNEKDAKASLSPAEHLAFIKECERYIEKLKSKGMLKAAQPLLRQGVVIQKVGSGWKQTDIGTDKKIQVGYYHIYAENTEAALQIAKENPEFAYVPSASIEVRQVKTEEAETGFVYPTRENG